MNGPVSRIEVSDLAAVIERARMLLDDGDVVAARLLAGEAYKRAKSAGQAAERIGAAEQLIRKARQLQGDALLIEVRAKIRLADEYDDAQAKGAAAKGRPKKSSSGEEFQATVSDLGLSHREIHEARKLRDAERAAPGIAERAIAARLARGLEPSKANLRAAVGTASATKAERGDNFYRTPREAVLTLLALERFHNRIWEPACGDGAISKILEAAGHDVLITDLVDRGCSKADGELQGVADFLKTVRNAKEDGEFSIVTNPPYGDALNGFVAHALREHKPKKMAMLLNLNALCGFNDPHRNFWMDDWPPARIIVFTRRLPMMHRDDWDGNEASSRMNTAWFVWERVAAYRGVDQARRPYGGQTIVRRADWKDYVKWEPEEGWRDVA